MDQKLCAARELPGFLGLRGKVDCLGYSPRPRYGCHHFERDGAFGILSPSGKAAVTALGHRVHPQLPALSTSGSISICGMIIPGSPGEGRGYLWLERGGQGNSGSGPSLLPAACPSLCFQVPKMGREGVTSPLEAQFPQRMSLRAHLAQALGEEQTAWTGTQ